LKSCLCGERCWRVLVGQRRWPQVIAVDMLRVLKWVLLGVGALVVLVVASVGGYVLFQVRAFDASVARVHDVALPQVRTSDDPEVLARGKHLVHSIGGCTAGECHGADLAGGETLEMGPVGVISGPNITPSGMLAVYSDAELARLIQHGIKKDGRSVLMMPVQDFYWFDEDDVMALISYLRTVKPVQKPNGLTRARVIGKVLDRQGKFPWDIARFVAALPRETPPDPEPTAAYGRFLVRLCTGCHGETLSGGPLPGAPPSIPVPLNITRHETGILEYTYDDFVKLMKTGVRKNGEQLDPFMAVEMTRNLNDTELRALWAELQTRPPKAFGGR
jgi:cytochrome c553